MVNEHVTKDMLIGEVTQKHPKAAFVFMNYGLHCVGCHVSAYETIEQGAMGHGMPEETLDEMMEDLNAFIEDELKKTEES
jgi:hybrid cluster-associated redox disulfide protein